MRLLTICSDGMANISQFVQWSGYSATAGIAAQEITKDVELLLKSVAAKSSGKFVDMRESIPTPSEQPQTKEEKLKHLKGEIDRLLEEITLLENYI